MLLVVGRRKQAELGKVALDRDRLNSQCDQMSVFVLRLAMVVEVVASLVRGRAWTY